MEAFKDFAVVNTAKGLSTLAKKISKKADAGTYICIEKNNSSSVTSISSAQLIVLGSEPVCKVSKENIMAGESLYMECFVNYTGSISPVIKWTRSDAIKPDSHDSISNVSLNSSVVSKLTTQMTMEDNAVTFMSNIYFNQPLSSSEKTGEHKATNAPHYKFIWIHKANVLFAPKTIDVAPKKDVYSIGDILYCVANGNPSPSYEWSEIESTDVISRLSSLTIASTGMENHSYKCTAANDVSGKTSISTTVTIHAVRRSSTGFDPVRSVTIAAGVICVILFLVIVVVVVRRFKDCLHSYIQRGAETGPDIVHNADIDENCYNPFPAENAEQHIGYAQPDDLGIRRTPFLQRGFAAEARRDEVNAICKQGPLTDGFPVYDEINNSQGASPVHQDVTHPVYGRVNKASKVTGQIHSQEELRVYGKVQKKREEQSPYSGKATSTSEAEENEIHETLESESCYTSSLKKVIIGADGTEYMDMSAARSLMQSEATAFSAHSLLFNRSQYAEIDHSKSGSK